MKQWIVILLLFAATTSIAACEELKAGNANFDLGDGYKVSFVLPDIGKSYMIEDADKGKVSMHRAQTVIRCLNHMGLNYLQMVWT
ncbi:MAG: hypothetical protein NTV30_08740 [Chloroflexi bacterium]|nr:hypothetical protein [Chloroflexota bacterium]